MRDDYNNKARDGYVNPGWSPAAWSERLRQLADRCERMHLERAALLREWAANVDRQRSAQSRSPHIPPDASSPTHSPEIVRY